MKNFKFIKSGFGEKLKLLLIPIGLLIGSFTMPAWAATWYQQNNSSHVYFNDYPTGWVSDPSSATVVFLMGRDNNYGGQGSGSQAYRMSHIAHTKIWYKNVPSWGTEDGAWYEYIAFRYASGTTGWDSWESTWVTDRAKYSNTKYAMTWNYDITGKTRLFTPQGSSTNTDMNVATELTKYTAYLRVKYDENRTGTYGSVITGETTWSHGVTFDFTGTYMTSASASAQSKISGLTKNCWTDGSAKWGYEQIPVTGEVRFELKGIDTGFELAGWAYSESASAPAYTPEDPTDVTFQVLSNTSYVAFIRRKQYTVTLNDNGGSGGSGSKTVKYDLSSNMTTSVSVPSKLGYTFQGYYTGQDGTGSMVINASGVWQKNVTNYTGTDGSSNPKWIRDDGATLYAKWTQTVTLHDNHGGSHNGSISAIYNGVMSSKVVPTYTDHTLDQGYYAQSSCTNKVMNLDGSLVASVTVSGTKWTSSGNKWIHDGDGTLYAHWKVNAPSSITCTDNVVTISVPTDATVHYTTNGSTPTSSSPTYDPSNKPVIASSGITVKAIAVQSGCTNSDVTSQAVTYTPVYTVGFTTTNTSKVTGETSVLENKTYTATFSANTGYTLPTSVTVTIGGVTKTVTTDYTWSVSDGVGTLSIKANMITGNVAITVVGVAKQCTINFDKNGGEGGDASVTATYDADMTTVTIPHIIGYKFDGYYDGETDGNGSGTKYYNADGTSARAWDVATESAQTLHAKWVADTNNFNNTTGDGKWSTAGNWSTGVVPENNWATIDVKSGITISDGDAIHVGEIILTAGSLTIEPGGSLEVAGTITKYGGSATETTDIIVNTSASKQASLILDNSAGNTKASVLVTSTASKVEDKYSFQFIAVPMTSVSVESSFAGQGIYTYVWNEGSGWERRGYYYDIFAFEGVGITQASGAGYGLTGTLASTADKNITLAYTSGDGVGMNMIGNSWTSPISIAALNGKIIGNAESTVYVYESGSWQGYPTSSAGSAVIPAMQAFVILATSGGGSLELNYDEAVRGVASANRTAALRAPKREASEMSDIYLHVSDNERATYLRLCEAEQFTNEFDNGWEARYIEGDGRSGQLYAQTDDKMTVLASPDLEGTVVGFIPGVASDYTISFSGDGKGYYLNDMELEQSTLIAEGNTYAFTPNESNNATRFVISKMPIHRTPTGIEEVNDGTKARKQLIDGVLYIIRNGRIYNAEGALVK